MHVSCLEHVSTKYVILYMYTCVYLFDAIHNGSVANGLGIVLYFMFKCVYFVAAFATTTSGQFLYRCCCYNLHANGLRSKKYHLKTSRILDLDWIHAD